jgi:hypothetical protein
MLIKLVFDISNKERTNRAIIFTCIEDIQEKIKCRKKDAEQSTM